MTSFSMNIHKKEVFLNNKAQNMKKILSLYRNVLKCRPLQVRRVHGINNL